MSTGSLYILEADSLLSAAQFVETDPMTSSGAVASIDIVEWRMTEKGSVVAPMAGWADVAAIAPISTLNQGLLDADEVGQ